MIKNRIYCVFISCFLWAVSEVASQRTVKRLKVGVIGASVSGLYSALILQDLGIDYEILEAGDQSGGRLLNHKFNETLSVTTSCIADNKIVLGDTWLMPQNKEYERIIGNQSWSLFNYLNNKLKSSNLPQLEIIQRRINTLQLSYFNGQKVFPKPSNDSLKFGESNGGFVPDTYAEKDFMHWFAKAFSPLLKQMENDARREEVLSNYTGLSVRGYLMNLNMGIKYPLEVVDWLDSIIPITGTSLSNFLRTLYNMNKNSIVPRFNFKGGIGDLIEAMESALTRKPLFNHIVKAIKPLLNSNYQQMEVKLSDESVKTYTHVISAIPYLSLQYINLTGCQLSYKKRFAIRQLRNQRTLKIAMKFRTRWWQQSEFTEGKPIFNGRTKTDLPIKTILYPDGDESCTKTEGILLVSDTYFKDSENLEVLSNEELEELCLNNLKEIFGSKIADEYTGEYVVGRYSQDKYNYGSFAYFDSDATAYHSVITEAEVNGKLLFAGGLKLPNQEWLSYAINSAYRAIDNLLLSTKRTKNHRILKEKWGTLD